MNLFGLKIINYTTTVKNVKKKWLKPVKGSIEKFPSVYQFCTADLYKFLLLLRKGIYPYEYIDSWEIFDETSLSDKEAFYRKLNEEGISKKDYSHAQKVWQVFEIKNIGKYHDLYIQCDTLLLADVFENFRDKCIGKYELDPAHFVSAPESAWQACFKKKE